MTSAHTVRTFGALVHDVRAFLVADVWRLERVL